MKRNQVDQANEHNRDAAYAENFDVADELKSLVYDISYDHTKLLHVGIANDTCASLPISLNGWMFFSEVS